MAKITEAIVTACAIWTSRDKLAEERLRNPKAKLTGESLTVAFLLLPSTVPYTFPEKQVKERKSKILAVSHSRLLVLSAVSSMSTFL